MCQQLALSTVFAVLFVITTARHDAMFWGNNNKGSSKYDSPRPDSSFWVFQGDIVLSHDQANMVDAPGTEKDGKYKPNRAYTASRDEKLIWYDGVIPYVVDCSLKNMPGLMEVVKGAMKEWESKTCLRFVERQEEDDYLTIFRGTHCYSTVGRAKGQRILSVGHGCEYHHVMLHELGHVIGFWHEQSRPDRDDYIRVVWNHVAKGWEFAFLKLSWRAVDTMRVPYDYSSIMHYPFNAFSKNRKRTLVPLRPVSKARPYKKLTERDILKANLLYSCRDREPPAHNSHSEEDESILARRRRYRRGAVDIADAKKPGKHHCKDTLDPCSFWAQRRYCELRKDFMPIKCPRSCNQTCDVNGKLILEPKYKEEKTSHTDNPVKSEKPYKPSKPYKQDKPSKPYRPIPRKPTNTISVVITDTTPEVQHGKKIVTDIDRKKLRRQAKRKARKELNRIVRKKNGYYCKDSQKSCKYWASRGFCSTRPDFMLKNCEKSCKACKKVEFECIDRDPRCRSWARWRYCTRHRYKNLMEKLCRRTCGHCKSGPKECKDREPKRCTLWKDNGYCTSDDHDIRRVMNMLCAKSCEFCSANGKNRPTVEPPCVDKFWACYGWYKLGYCETKPAYMDEYCRKSCGLCTTGRNKKNDVCLDNEVDCEMRKAQGYCKKRKKYMEYNCRKTCGMCPRRKRHKPGRSSCRDRSRWCVKWASYGYCHTKALYMIKSCKRSCGICDDVGPNPPSLSRNEQAPCVNKRRSCGYWASIGVCDVRPDFMYKDCRLACRACIPEKKDLTPSCDNKEADDSCDHWAKLGKCKSRPEYMMINCHKSCNACPPRPHKLMPEKPKGILCQHACREWVSRGLCMKWKNRCLRSCLAQGCDEKPVRPTGTCAEPFGAGWDYKLKDDAFTASSSVKKGKWDFGARNARLYKEDDPVYKRIGGWCSEGKKGQWLQVDLGAVRIVTAVATQGRDKFFEHVKTYQLGLSIDGKRFFKYREKGKLKTFQGNCDHFSPVVNTLHKPHAVRYIRFYPITHNNICMRVEIYGCNNLRGQAKIDYPHAIHPRHYYYNT